MLYFYLGNLGPLVKIGTELRPQIWDLIESTDNDINTEPSSTQLLSPLDN